MRGRERRGGRREKGRRRRGGEKRGREGSGGEEREERVLRTPCRKFLATPLPSDATKRIESRLHSVRDRGMSVLSHCLEWISSSNTYGTYPTADSGYTSLTVVLIHVHMCIIFGEMYFSGT